MPHLYAVLIGINGYKQCRPLEGCVSDTLATGRYFEELCRVQDNLKWTPAYLLAPAGAQEEAIVGAAGIQYKSPTRANILAAFDHFEQARDGDFCLLYYSGHGSTTTAPEVFRGYEPGDILQTLVCIDSRVDGRPDILDKEIGYRIAKALDGKHADPEKGKTGVHFLAIFDSCHSGTITRGDDAAELTPRMATPGSAPETIDGFTRDGNCFYLPFRPGSDRVEPGGIRHARHISLSAARDTESAIEKYFPAPDGRRMKRGVFTWSLLETLRQNGAGLSYAELMRRVELMVRSRVDNQIPVLGKHDDTRDDQLLFFRNELRSPPAEIYEAGYDQIANRWTINAGALNGVPDPKTSGQAFVRLENLPPVRIVAVEPGWSTLDPEHLQTLDHDRTYAATLDPACLFTVPVAFGLSINEAQKREIEAFFGSDDPPAYARLQDDTQTAQYLIQSIPDLSGTPCFALMRPGSNIPVFMRTPGAKLFVSDLEKVCRYERVLQLGNPGSTLPSDAISVRIGTLEGQQFTGETFKQISRDEHAFTWLPHQSEQLPYPEAVRISGKYVNGQLLVPAIKVEIRPKPGSVYWVAGLYCDEKYGITGEYLALDRIGEGEKAGYMEIDLGHGTYRALPLSIDPGWMKLGVTTIQDNLVLLVSTQKFNVGQYEQKGVVLDTMRSVDGSFLNNKSFFKEDWKVIRIPVYIRIPAKTRILGGVSPVDFGAFQIQAPPGFKAVCDAFSPDGVQPSGKNALPPANLWDGFQGNPEVFSRGVFTLPGAHLSMLELLVSHGDISENAPLVIQPIDPPARGETIVPFGYDAGQKRWVSFGHTDAQGAVRIDRLPEPTPGRLGDTNPDANQSVKLFFCKLTGIEQGTPVPEPRQF